MHSGLLWTFPMNGITRVLCDWLFSFRIVLCRFICVVGCVSTSFLFIAAYYSIAWAGHATFHFSVSWRTLWWFSLSGYYEYCCCKHSCMCLWGDARFRFPGHLPRSGIAEPYGSCRVNLRNCLMLLQSGCMILRSHEQCMKGSLFPLPHWHLFIVCLLL